MGSKGGDQYFRGCQGRPLSEDICTKISKMKNVAAMQISGEGFQRRQE